MNIGLICMIFILVVAFVDYYLKNAKQVDEYVTGTISGKYIKTSIVGTADDMVSSYKDVYYLIVQYELNITPNGDPIKIKFEELDKVISSSKQGDQSGMKKVKEVIVTKEFYDKAIMGGQLQIALDKKLSLF